MSNNCFSTAKDAEIYNAFVKVMRELPNSEMKNNMSEALDDLPLYIRDRMIHICRLYPEINDLVNEEIAKV